MQDNKNGASQIYCPSCQRKIEASIFLLHEARCQIKKSRVINEKSNIKQQISHQNTPRGTEGFNHQRPNENSRIERKKIFSKQEEERIPCTNCGYMQTLLELDTHPNECAFSGKPCTYCGQSFPQSLMSQHLHVCNARRPPRPLPHIHHEGTGPQEENIDSDEEDPFENHFFGNLNYIFGNSGRNNRGPVTRTIRNFNGRTIIQETDEQGRLAVRQIMGPPQSSTFEPLDRDQFFRRRRNTSAFRDFFRLIELMALRSGGVEQGLTKQQLKNLARIKYKLNSNTTEKDLCTICYCQFQQEEKIIQLKCKHIYHEQCIVKWLEKNPKCPVCKAPQTNRPIYNEEE